MDLWGRYNLTTYYFEKRKKGTDYPIFAKSDEFKKFTYLLKKINLIQMKCGDYQKQKKNRKFNKLFAVAKINLKNKSKMNRKNEPFKKLINLELRPFKFSKFFGKKS